MRRQRIVIERDAPDTLPDDAAHDIAHRHFPGDNRTVEVTSEPIPEPVRLLITVYPCNDVVDADGWRECVIGALEHPATNCPTCRIVVELAP
jgi:hypothetical protein